MIEELGMVTHTFWPSTWEAENLWVQGQSGQFPDSQVYIEKPSLENKQNQNQNKRIKRKNWKSGTSM